MSMRNYGIYRQGAIFHTEDFDPCKVILTVSEKIANVVLPDKIKTALDKNLFDVKTASEICEMLSLGMPSNAAEIEDYAFISNALVSEAEYCDWFNGNEPLMGTKGADVFIFSGIEGEYVYDSLEKENELVEECFMISLYFPTVWKISDYISENKGCRTKGEVLRLIRKTAKPLLKDDIDWTERLGCLIGSTCC